VAALRWAPRWRWRTAAMKDGVISRLAEGRPAVRGDAVVTDRRVAQPAPSKLPDDHIRVAPPTPPQTPDGTPTVIDAVHQRQRGLDRPRHDEV
jgi:hypothetical protein